MSRHKREIVVEITKYFVVDCLKPRWMVSVPRLEGDWSGVSPQVLDEEIKACVEEAYKHVDRLNGREARGPCEQDG